MKNNTGQVLTVESRLSKLILLSLLLLLVGCSSMDNGVQEIESVDLTVEVTKDRIADIFAQMKTLGDKEGKVVTFSMADIKSKDANSKMRVSNLSKKAFIFNAGSDRIFNSPDDDYTVTCTWGNGETEVTECGNDVACAGSATWDCLENGGCATLCNNKLMYVPSSYKVRANKLDQLAYIMRSVERKSKNSNGDSFAVSISFDKDIFWLNKTSKIDKPVGTTSRDWQVDCFDSNGELLWSDTYDVWDEAGAAMIQCTNDGGCAGICTIETRWIGTGGRG